MFPNAKKLPLESADGGGGAGEVDAVWEVAPGRFIVVEAKGGTADIGAADSAGFYAEQGTLAHTLITASKMILRANAIESTDPMRAQAQLGGVLAASVVSVALSPALAGGWIGRPACIAAGENLSQPWSATPKNTPVYLRVVVHCTRCLRVVERAPGSKSNGR
jgi:hypothetical protein